MNRDSRNDEKLMLAYRDGEARAFDELYRRHSGRIYGFLRRRLSRREEVDEVFQQVFTKLHQSRFGYDPAHGFDPWLFVITKTTLLDHWRSRSRRPEFPDDRTQELLEKDHTLVPGIEAAILAGVSETQSAALATLPADQQEVIRLRVMDELSFSEIARRMGRSEISARQLLSRGLRKLRAALEGVKE